MTRGRWSTAVGSLAMAALAAGCVSEDLRPPPPPRFVGSATCAACHAEAYRSWRGTYHAKMIRPVRQGLLKAAWETWNFGGPRRGNIDGKPYRLEDVRYVVGAFWKQHFLVAYGGPGGGHQFLDKQFNRMSGQWEAYSQKSTWETNCATCHATGVRVTGYDENDPSAQKVTVSELNIGCEACHGPGSTHAAAPSRSNIFAFAGKSKAEASRVCGYCHVRVENDAFRTAQGHSREDLPHPVPGNSYKAGENWTLWYPERVRIAGVQPDDPVDAAHAGDLEDAYFVDDAARKANSFDARKHRQQYAEFLQSSHHAKGIASCADCHSPHAAAGKAIVAPARTCRNCHDASFTVDRYMPALGSTAGDLFVRSHTFSRLRGRLSSGRVASGKPVYRYPDEAK